MRNLNYEFLIIKFNTDSTCRICISPFPNSNVSKGQEKSFRVKWIL